MSGEPQNTEGRVSISQTQRAAFVKTGHMILAVDPDTGEPVHLTPEQLTETVAGSPSLSFTDDSIFL